MGFGLSMLISFKALAEILIFIFLRKFNFTLLSQPFLYAFFVSIIISVASHPSINRPKLLDKKHDGTFPIWSLIIFSPYLYFIQLFLAIRIFFTDNAPYSEICSGFYVGAWPYSPEKLPRGNHAIIDCTCELPKKVGILKNDYFCVPTWDTRAPSIEEIEAAVRWACKKRVQGVPIYIHCAYGHGRSVAVMCALLVSVGEAENWRIAEKLIKRKRPCINMTSLHYKALDQCSKYQKLLKSRTK